MVITWGTLHYADGCPVKPCHDIIQSPTISGVENGVLIMSRIDSSLNILPCYPGFNKLLTPFMTRCDGKLKKKQQHRFGQLSPVCFGSNTKPLAFDLENKGSLHGSGLVKDRMGDWRDKAYLLWWKL